MIVRTADGTEFTFPYPDGKGPKGKTYKHVLPGGTDLPAVVAEYALAQFPVKLEAVDEEGSPVKRPKRRAATPTVPAAVPAGASNGVVVGYCVKCKDRRDIQNPVAIIQKNGSPATRGTCPVCGTGMYRMGRVEGLHA